MGIRFQCPNGHRLNVKTFLAGKRGICPECSARFIVPSESGGRVEAVDDPSGSLPVTLAGNAPDPIERTPLVEDPLLATLEIPVVQERPWRRRPRQRKLTGALLVLVILLALVLAVVVWNQF